MKRTPTSLAILYVAVAVVVLLVLGLVVRTADNTDANTETLSLIKSCTIKPAGKCAQVQREQMAGFVRLIAVTASCADKPGRQTERQIERCVDRRLKRAAR